MVELNAKKVAGWWTVTLIKLAGYTQMIFNDFFFVKKSFWSSEAATVGDPWKKVFLKIAQILQENTIVGVYF